jgi:hypothetical protein
MQNETLKNNLILILVNFSFNARTITKLDAKNISLNDSMQIVKSTIEKLKPVSGPIGDIVKNKKIILFFYVDKKEFIFYFLFRFSKNIYNFIIIIRNIHNSGFFDLYYSVVLRKNIFILFNIEQHISDSAINISFVIIIFYSFTHSANV